LRFELVLEFSERFTQAKQTKTMIDISDLDHYSLRILTDDASSPNMIIPSDVAKDYQQKFQEVLVDEYQAINHVQETIISLVSDDSSKGNRFMVGDVKQSSYRVSHAGPTLFQEKD